MLQPLHSRVRQIVLLPVLALLLLEVIYLFTQVRLVVDDRSQHLENQHHIERNNETRHPASSLLLLDADNDNDNNNIATSWRTKQNNSWKSLEDIGSSLLTAASIDQQQQQQQQQQANCCSCVDAHSNPIILRDIHMVLIGDSLMRYQYLSLVYRLRHGVWFNDSQWYYNLVNERSFGDPYHNHTWGEFLFHTNRILQPYEVCDCHRKPVIQMDQIVENRYYYDPILNNSVVYLLSYGHAYPVVGRLLPHLIRNQSQQWQMTAFQEYHLGAAAWEYADWADVIRHHIQHLDPQPRHVVMNAGAWKHNFGWDASSLLSSSSSASSSSSLLPSTTNSTWSKATKNLFQVMHDTPQYQYVWRTTTYTKARISNHGLSIDAFMCEHLFSLCVNVSFTKSVDRSLLWDKTHFLEPVYRAINEEMLGLLGYLPDGYTHMNLSDVLE